MKKPHNIPYDGYEDDAFITSIIKAGAETNSVLHFRDLFHIIFKKLQPLYLMDCGAVLLYDEGIKKIRQAFIAEYSPITDEITTDTINDEVALNVITAEIAGFQFPVLKSRQEWEEDYQENHCLINKNSDYSFHCYIPLEVDNQTFGTLELHNRKKALSSEGLTFCTNIADLLAEVACFLSNAVQADEDIEQVPIITHADTTHHHTGELQALLNFSATLSGVKSKEDLGIIIEHLRQVFDFNHFEIRLLDETPKSYSLYLSSVKDYQGFANVELMKTTPNNSNDPVFSAVRVAESPVVFDFEMLAAENNVPEYVRFWQANQVVQMIGLPMIKGDDVIGVLLINFDQKRIYTEADLYLLRSVSAQISITIANVLACQKINDQLAEIGGYKQQLQKEKLYQQEDVPTGLSHPDIIGRAPQMQPVFQLLNQVAGTETTVLILGETGTGKELIARAIHNDSDRRAKTMIKVNCAAIPPNLIESELFGHEKGSFTGATERRIGKFELANNSTLFLDEIGELSLDLQVKLLRVLQEKEIERVGGTVTIKTDVRIVSATNRDLLAEVEAGRFRSDLFYRLNVFPVKLPALRNRKEDIPLLAHHFLQKFVSKTAKKIVGFSQKALQDMQNYHWPGNVRELEHLIERQILLTSGQMIREIAIPSAARSLVVNNDEVFKVKTIDENERDHIFSVLKMCNGKISGKDGAAKILGVPATTLNSKIKRLGLTKSHLY